MGKGDKKTRRGKLFMGSYGNTRPQNNSVNVKKVVAKVLVTEKPKAKPKINAKVKDSDN